MAARVLSISNVKGGVGKTTTTANLGAALNKMGKRVLLVDMDAQASLTLSLGLMEEQPATIYTALRGESSLSPLTILPGFDIVPSEFDLSGAEAELAKHPNRDTILRRLLQPMRERYDYILVDTPPSPGFYTINAFSASDEVVVVLQAEYLALRGMEKFMALFSLVRKSLNPSLSLGGVVITQYDGRKSLHRTISEQIEEAFQGFDGCKVFSTRIRSNIALAEAPTQGEDIFRYSPKSNGAADYLNLAEELDAWEWR